MQKVVQQKPKPKTRRKNLAQQVVLSHTARQMNQLGPGRLGRLLSRYGVPMAPPGDGAAQAQLGQALGVDCADLTDSVVFYDYRDDTFPLTETRFDSIWNSERDVLRCGATEDEDDSEDCAVHRTNISCGSTFPCPFLMTGFCMVAVAGSELFSYYGAYNPTAPDPNSEQPNIRAIDTAEAAPHAGGAFGLVPDLTNVVPPGNWSHTQVGVNWPVWHFLEQYMLSTRVDVKVCQKLQLVSELLSSIGMCLMNPGFEGAGTAGMPTGPWTRALNDRLQEMDGGVVLQVNTSEDEPTTTCYPPAIVYFMKGATKNPGAMGKPYMLSQPAFFSALMNPTFSFVNTADDDCIKPIRALSTISQQSPQANYLGDVSNITNSCGTNTFMPYGRMSMGLLLFGYEMSPMAVAAWIASMCSVQSPQVAGIRELAGLPARDGLPSGKQWLREIYEEAEQKWGKITDENSLKRYRFQQLSGFLNGGPDRPRLI